jgi:UDP-glucose 4-epimerase
MTDKKTVLVTGGCGYIGSHIVKYFAQQNWNVVIVDWRVNDDAEKYATRSVLNDFDSDETYSTLIEEMPDAVVHCAGFTSVPESVAKPSRYYINNVAKSINFIDDVQALDKVPAFVFSSSASVYGEPLTLPVYETAKIDPISPYGHTKAMIEQVLEDTHKATNMPYAALRYFNACGADILDSELGQRPGASHIIARLLEAKLNKKKFTLYGDDYKTFDGSCIRDYIHVADLAKAHYKMVEHLLNEGGDYQLNLGTNNGLSNLEIINAVRQVVGHFDFDIAARRAGDPDKLIASADKAMKLLDWKPQDSDIHTIVDSAWRWYNKQV